MSLGPIVERMPAPAEVRRLMDLVHRFPAFSGALLLAARRDPRARGVAVYSCRVDAWVAIAGELPPHMADPHCECVLCTEARAAHAGCRAMRRDDGCAGK